MFRQGQCKLVKAALTQRKLSLNLISKSSSAALNASQDSKVDQSMALCAAAALFGAAIAHQMHTKYAAKCEESMIPPPLKEIKCSTTLYPSHQPQHLMLHRFKSKSKKARQLADKYDVDWNTVLGFGTYGAVYCGINSSNGDRVALKVISKKGTDQSSFRRETTALLRISDNGAHPNISCLRDVYEDDNYYYLVLDLICGGEIFDHLVNDGVFSEDNAIRLMRQAASALFFLHTIGVVHADLKPENLMLCSASREHGTLRIIDFGSARVDDDNRYHVDGTEKPVSLRSEVSTGTVAYWAPERFVKGSEATPATDMWSTGVILYIMLTGVHPFDPEGCTDDKVVEERIKSNPKAPFNTQCINRLSPSAIDLIEKLMDPDPSKRLDAAGMLEHSWIKGYISEPTMLHTYSNSKVTNSLCQG